MLECDSFLGHHWANGRRDGIPTCDYPEVSSGCGGVQVVVLQSWRRKHQVSWGVFGQKVLRQFDVTGCLSTGPTFPHESDWTHLKPFPSWIRELLFRVKKQFLWSVSC